MCWQDDWILEWSDCHVLIAWVGTERIRQSHINVLSGTDNGQIDMLFGSGNDQIVMYCRSGQICLGLESDQTIMGRKSGSGNGQIVSDNVRIRS